MRSASIGAVLLLCFAGLQPAFSQAGSSAGIYGSILDPQGAMIAGARVTLQHVPTNQTRKTLSNHTFARITSTGGGPRILQFGLKAEF